MKERLPKKVYLSLKQEINNGVSLDHVATLADKIFETNNALDQTVFQECEQKSDDAANCGLELTALIHRQKNSDCIEQRCYLPVTTKNTIGVNKKNSFK